MENSRLISKEEVKQAILVESRKFEDYYSWLENNMPRSFFEDVSQENSMLIAHNLMGFHLQEYLSSIHLKRQAIVLCLDSADADLRILDNYAMYGIKNYQCYISRSPPPFSGVQSNLRVAVIYFTETEETVDEPFPTESQEKLRGMVKERNPKLTDEEFDKLMQGINRRFLRSLSLERLIIALQMFFRAQTRDSCQYEVQYDEDWAEKGTASMEITLAWRNTPKHNFLFRLARVIHRHGLVMKRVNATYVNPYSKDSILVMALKLHGSDGQAVWDVADIPDFLRELVTVKYFASFDIVDELLVRKGFVSGNMGNFLRAMINFIHQTLVHVDANFYNYDTIEKDICRFPELAVKLCDAFTLKFDPDFLDFEKYEKARLELLSDIQKLDTGNEANDTRRRNVLSQGINFIYYTLKTNFYCMNITSLSFRLDPQYLNHIPFERSKKFPELPYAIFFIKGMHFFGFHIRFKDLARGGLRTVFLEQSEHIEHERNAIFTECYNLALTQHMKNKDIPEGGSKGIIFLKPYEQIESESGILKKEFESAKLPSSELEHKIQNFVKEQKLECLYQAQRSFIDSFLKIINCEADGTLITKYVVDYWKRPEYIYLGPDENMHDRMIQWIADFSVKKGYKPGSSFISSKPRVGINHKEYGVTSLGVNVYMEEILKYMGINPLQDVFTIKMSGGPDGDVAGNEIFNIKKYYPHTAKLVALTDVSGTINDSRGLDLDVLVDLFHQAKPIKHYPPEKLSEGGFLLDRLAKRNETSLAQQTLCWRKKNGKVVEDWLSGSEMNNLYRNNVHQTKADIFIPAGGRPRTLNETNYHDFLDETGKPTSKAIVEGANLYITPATRRIFEKMGILIIRDSSANKTGVICSSFEVLCGLALGDELFMQHKETLVREILERLRRCALNEANLLLRTHRETGEYLTEISDKISKSINHYTYQLLDYLDKLPLSNEPGNPLHQTFLNYCLPSLRKDFQEQLLKEIPEHHKKAVISCHIAAQLVYQRGLGWEPTIVDILPLLLGVQEVN